MEDIDSVHVLPLARFSLTPGRLAELIELLQQVNRVWATAPEEPKGANEG